MYKMIFDFNINIFVPHSLLSETRVFCLDFLPVRNPQIKKFTITGEYKIFTLLLEAGIHGGVSIFALILIIKMDSSKLWILKSGQLL